MQNELTNLFQVADISTNVESDSEGCPVARLSDNETVPLLDGDLSIQIPQPGSVRGNKELVDKIGKIIVTGNKQIQYTFDEMWLMPITVLGYSFRRYSDFNASQRNELLCWSNNGLEPAPRVQNPCSTQCARFVESRGDTRLVPVCGEAVWANGQRPACRQSVRLAFLDLETKSPMQIELHGTGMTAWNNLRSSYRTTRNIARLKGLKVSSYVVHLLAQNNGTYVKPEMDFMQAPEKFGDVSRFQPLLSYYLKKLYSPTNPEPGITEPNVPTDVDEVLGPDSSLSEFDM